MRAHTKRKHEIGKRFAIVIGVAAAGVMALGAQTAAGDVKHDTKLWHSNDGGRNHYGDVRSEEGKCEGGRRVVMFKVRPGADPKLGADVSARRHIPPTQGESHHDRGFWQVNPWKSGTTLHPDDRVYAKVKRVRKDGFVCRADRSRTIPAD